MEEKMVRKEEVKVVEKAETGQVYVGIQREGNK